jgi:hypothetical protein
MVLYVAVVAVVNLGLGYGLAVYLGAGRMPRRMPDTAEAEYDYDSTADYDSDNSYESSYESDLETAASA